MNNFYEGISFTKEEEESSSTFSPLLDVKVTKTVNGFVTSYVLQAYPHRIVH